MKQIRYTKRMFKTIGNIPYFLKLVQAQQFRPPVLSHPWENLAQVGRKQASLTQLTVRG